MGCPSCGRGFHFECDNEGCENCHTDPEVVIRNIKNTANVGAPIKDPEDVRDPHSTGRKRAAQLYPIFKGEACEWRGKKNCGGGIPIIGCIDGVQQARHHGPVKNTLRNEPTNVHRICTKCHNRWHTVNDPEYDEKKYEDLPHSPEAATELDLIVGEASWKVKKIKLIHED